ncbi:hypothetical protein J1N35_041360, partial [Gossypium stocksii]
MKRGLLDIWLVKATVPNATIPMSQRYILLSIVPFHGRCGAQLYHLKNSYCFSRYHLMNDMWNLQNIRVCGSHE